jgi:SAM-dependent methyltransferase
MVGVFAGATVLLSALSPSEERSMKRQIRDALDLAISRYPSKPLELAKGLHYDLNALMKSSAQRCAYHLDVVLKAIPKGGRVADVGGGLTPHCHALALLGYRGVLVDDFGDLWHEDGAEVLEGQKRDGVEVVSCDILQGLALDANSFDAIMTFDCLEHLHHSPKKMLTDAVAALKPGGLLFLGVPNCVNLRKRLTVPFGVGKWSRMEEWYDSEKFRGHVREPDVDDLRYIGKSLGLENVKVVGMNWLGYESHFPLVRLLVPFADRLLQLWPSLCANIYLVGTKPAG